MIKGHLLARLRSDTRVRRLRVGTYVHRCRVSGDLYTKFVLQTFNLLESSAKPIDSSRCRKRASALTLFDFVGRRRVFFRTGANTVFRRKHASSPVYGAACPASSRRSRRPDWPTARTTRYFDRETDDDDDVTIKLSSARADSRDKRAAANGDDDKTNPKRTYETFSACVVSVFSPRHLKSSRQTGFPTLQHNRFVDQRERERKRFLI